MCLWAPCPALLPQGPKAPRPPGVWIETWGHSWGGVTSKHQGSSAAFRGSRLAPLRLTSRLAPQVIFLEKRVSELERDTAANGEQHSRLRQENLQLVHR